MILHTFTTIVGTVFHLDSNNKNISSLHYSWLYMGKFSFFVLCRTVRDPRTHCMYNFTKRILYWKELVDVGDFPRRGIRNKQVSDIESEKPDIESGYPDIRI